MSIRTRQNQTEAVAEEDTLTLAVEDPTVEMITTTVEMITTADMNTHPRLLLHLLLRLLSRPRYLIPLSSVYRDPDPDRADMVAAAAKAWV
jgi:hypothetical protein